MLLNPGEHVSDGYLEELAKYVYGVVRDFKLMFVSFPGVVHWNNMPAPDREKWIELVRYRFVRPFADAMTSEPCVDAIGWPNEGMRHTGYELLASTCRIIQLGVIWPTQSCCNKHAALSITSMYNCGLEPGHKGVCVPAGAIPIPEAKPQYQPGEDE